MNFTFENDDMKIMMTTTATAATATMTTAVVAAAVSMMATTANHSYKFENWKYARKRHVQVICV